MPDYQKGKIYKLWSPQGNEIYIGSTVNSLAKRLSQHKAGNNCCNSKYLFENYNVVRIELIEEYPCNNKMELDRKEGEHIRGNDKCLNRSIAGRTKKEYNENNKEKLKEYYQNNKEKKKEYRKEYYENNKEKIREKITCECGGRYSNDHKTHHLKTKKHIDFTQQQEEQQPLE
jgi:hypothetical protein